MKKKKHEMARICVIDADRLSDKDLVGDSDFASFVNDIMLQTSIILMMTLPNMVLIKMILISFTITLI